MEMTFDNNIPIYIQVLEYMKIYLISGVFKCGERLPSVREFSTSFKVNPNTMQKALSELESMNLIYTERTNGKFVTQNTELIEKLKDPLVHILLLLLNNMELLKIKNLNKTFDKKEILKDVNLTISSGKIVGLLGKNGAGKTTLIKLINDLLTPTSGEILINGEKVGVETKKRVSYLPERTYLNRQMKVSEVIEFFKDFYEDFDDEKAIKLLEDLDLDINEHLSKMSKGMQEKVQLVLVMSRKADLYILDEPLGGVDPATRDYILDTILSNFNENASVIISTHLISDIERVLDEVIFIDKGRVALQSDADKLRNKEKSSIDEIFRRMFKC